MLGVIAQIDGYDPVAAAAVTLRGSSVDDADVCHINGQVWWPGLIQLPTLGYDFFDGGFGGAIGTPGSSMTLAVEPWPNLPRYNLADARIQLWTGDVGAPWANWTQRFDGRVSNQPAIDQGLATLGFAVDDRWLDKPLLATYAGTTGAEGPAALKGTVKPLALGAPRYATGVLVDSVNIVFQVSGYGLIEDFEVAMERLLRFGVSLGDYPSYAALIGATVPRGCWATCKALGMVRFGAPPAGQISFLLKGDKAGPNGWARKPGQLIRRIALMAGGAGKIDDASLDALDAARPYNLSIFVGEQTTARELIQSIAASVNAVAGVSWLGKLFAAPVGIGAPSLTLQADGSALPPVADVQQVEMGTPWAKLAIEAERTVTVHAWSDIATEIPLVDLGDYSGQPAGTVFREGNVVQDQGAAWRYINPVPTAGNAPPTLPTTSNAYWRVMAPPGADGEDAQGAVLYDPFNYATVAEFEAAWNRSGSGERTIVTTTDIGGSAVQLGDNAGSDTAIAVSAKTLPYSPEDLYEVEFDVEVASSDPLTTFYLGVAAQNAAGGNLPGSYGTYCYVAASGVPQQANAGRRKYRGYMRGRAGSGAGNPTNSIDSPAPLPNGTVKIAALVYANYSARPGTVIVHEMTLRKMEDVSTVVIGNWSSAYTYARNNGAYYGGRLWGSKVDGNLNHQPPSSGTGDAWWYLIGDKGDPGTPGSDGADGLSIAELTVYRRAASAPATPTDGSYNVGTKVLTPPLGWSTARPAPNGQPCWEARGTAAAVSGSVAPTWAGVAQAAQDGRSTNIIYRLSTTAPATPAASAGVPSGWSDDPDTAPGSGLQWASFGTLAYAGGNWTWQTPKRVEGLDGSPGADGDDGRDAIVYYQTGTPTGMIAGDTWYNPSTKAWQRYSGSAWQPLLGAIASFDALNASYIVAGTIVASRFMLDNGVDLSAVVPGSLNTAVSATQGAAISLPITINSPNTSGPNGNGTQAIVTTPAVPIGDAGDSVFIDGSFVVTAGTARGYVMLQKSTNGSTWVDLLKINQDGSYQGVTAKTHSFSLEDTDHAPGNLYFRILMRQSAAQSTGDGTAGTNFTITSGAIRVRRMFSK